MLKEFRESVKANPPAYQKPKQVKFYESELWKYVGRIPGIFRQPMIPTGLFQYEGTTVSIQIKCDCWSYYWFDVCSTAKKEKSAG